MASKQIMINQQVKENLKDCKVELLDIKNILSPGSVSLSHKAKYLTNYSIIRACGTIELSYKTLIADCFDEGQSDYIKNFISKRVRNSSSNPEIGNIRNLLASFDENLRIKFNEELNKETEKKRWLESLESLRKARNDLAHGRTTSVGIVSALQYFEDSRNILKVLDKCLNLFDEYPSLDVLFSD